MGNTCYGNYKKKTLKWVFHTEIAFACDLSTNRLKKKNCFGIETEIEEKHSYRLFSESKGNVRRSQHFGKERLLRRTLQLRYKETSNHSNGCLPGVPICVKKIIKAKREDEKN
ncbi:hypothetical protein CEXT_463281 [Caerostris extrusa]|uniref:Uncharacterized protein n=1 Tax=Caerostris extrusa TaxID=172846 RepID=A0AAV4SD39_CAEEX|nr:hypothetical protein CEXT_463281 [Caerostris extrusa]